MIIIHAGLKVKPEQETAFLEAVNLLIPATRAEEGNICYDFMKDTQIEHTYKMIELWRDLEATKAHNTSVHFTSFIQKAQDFMAAPMDLKVFNGEPVSL